MTSNVIRELERYGEHAEGAAPAITMDEIAGRRLETLPGATSWRPARPERQRRGWGWAFVAGCIVTLLVVGGTTFLLGLGGDDAPVAAEPAAVTGTITISVEGLSGMEGYQMLAGVWSEAHDPPLVGGAFWTLIDGDPFSDTDLVHPPAIPNPRSVTGTGDWGAEDYLWNETAQLTPGTYQISIWANPNKLAPYGSHLPAEPIERTCLADVEVTAGENTTIIVTGIPAGGEPCQIASDSAP